MPKFTTIVADGETAIGIEVDREIRRSIDLLSVIVSNGLAARYHKGLEKRPAPGDAALP